MKFNRKYLLIFLLLNFLYSNGQSDSVVAKFSVKKIDSFVVKVNQLYILLDGELLIKREYTQIKKSTDSVRIKRIYEHIDSIMYYMSNGLVYNGKEVLNLLYFRDFLFKRALLISSYNFEVIKYKNKFRLRNLSLCVIPKRKFRNVNRREKRCIFEIPLWRF